MHKPYEQVLNHPADFRVKYRFYSPEEGGRKTLPFQGYRSDFWYNHNGDQTISHMFMIFPEFEDENGQVILENDAVVPSSGTACMWVFDAGRRDFHLGHIKPGLKCFFVEGAMRAAECEVIEVLGLGTNPKTQYPNRGSR